MNRFPELHECLLHPSKTHDGVPNVCRVTRVDEGPSVGFTAIFVNPSNTHEKRIPTDREFFVWIDDLRYFEPYRGIPAPPLQPQLFHFPEVS